MRLITRTLAVILMAGVSVSVLASEGGVALDTMAADHTNKESLQRGATLFTNYCMGCHSMEYARYKKVAEDLGIPTDIYKENLIFTGANIGELMKNSMNKEQAANWFGNAPPDLTLESRLRGDDWIYSYLRGFYKDESRPMGINNVVFPNVGMPHVLLQLQGLCAVEPTIGHQESVDPLSGSVKNQKVCTEWATKGSMTAAEYDSTIYDLTNFLSYMGDPVKVERERLGMFVLIFIAIFFIFAYLLNREYWKDVH